MADSAPDALSLPAWRRRMPHPASRYSRDLIADRPAVFDRETGEPVPWGWLKTYGRALVRHHLHSEMKFLGGYDNERGVLRRRHVHVWAAIPIGKLRWIDADLGCDLLQRRDPNALVQRVALNLMEHVG